MKDRSHDQAMAELFGEEPAFAADYLAIVLQAGEQADVIALRQMAIAIGGVPAIAEKAQLNPTLLYRTLSATGNPNLRSLFAVLKAMGLQLAVIPANPDRLIIDLRTQRPMGVVRPNDIPPYIFHWPCDELHLARVVTRCGCEPLWFWLSGHRSNIGCHKQADGLWI